MERIVRFTCRPLRGYDIGADYQVVHGFRKGLPMRRRKKTIIAVLAIAAGAAALLFWPRDHPEARRAFTALRGMVEVHPEEGGPAAPEIVRDATAQVELEI